MRPDFKPEGLEEFWQNESKVYNEETQGMLKEIVAKVKLLISERLNEYFGDSWLIKGLPKNIYTRAKGEADEAVYVHVTSTGEEIDIPIWDYVTLPECKQIILNGKPVKIKSPIAAQKLRIGYVPEDRLTEGLCLAQPIADNIALSSLKRLAKAFGVLKRQDVIDEGNKWRETFSIKTDDVRKNASTLSGGNQQKIVLAKWVYTDPKILILDEPTRGVDIGAKKEIYNIINQMAADGVAVIMVSSELPEVLGMSDRIAVVHEGKITGILDAAEADQAKVMTLATGGSL